jgi:hypothetical protein
MDDPTRALLDRAELDEVMNRYAAALDRRDWARLGTVFADGEIETDFTSMGVKQVFRGPAERWVDAVRQTITGFDATHGPDTAGMAHRQLQADRHLQRRRPSADGHRVPQGNARRVTGAPSPGRPARPGRRRARRRGAVTGGRRRSWWSPPG